MAEVHSISRCAHGGEHASLRKQRGDRTLISADMTHGTVLRRLHFCIRVLK